MNKRLPEIDFVKGVAIVSVLLLHTLPEKILYLSFASLHIWQAVPLFIFVTFYLSFKSLVANSERDILSNYFSSKRIIRVAKEVALPFFAVVALQVFLRSIRAGESFDISDLCRGWGGGG
jgi:peptidoglycan/LPS O-acetylase OafA/YrhL